MGESHRDGGALLERGAELAGLDGLLATACGGSGALVVIEGPPGIGKSALVRACAQHAAALGMQSLQARGDDVSMESSFAAMRELLAPAVGPDAFSGSAAFAAPVFSGDADVAPEADRAVAVLHGLYWLVADHCDHGPLALLVDDAHWGDDASLAFAGFLARRAGELPLALVLAARAPEPGAVAELVRVLADPETLTLSPEPLSLTGVSALLTTSLRREPEAEFAVACRGATHGNPVLLGELTAEIRARGIEPVASQAGSVGTLRPPGVRSTAVLRLGQMTGDARRLAHTLAVLGDRTPLAVAAELAGLDEDAAHAAALELEEAGLVTREDGLGFVHPLLRAAVTDDVATVERVRGHAAAARVLARHGAEPDAVAAQLLRAEPAADPWVVEMLRAGAARALELGDPEPAVAFLERALAEPAEDRAGVLLELGLAEARTDAAAGIARLREAVTAGGGAAAALPLARLLNLTGCAGEAAEVLEAAGDEPELRAELLATAYVRISAHRRLAPLIASLEEPADPPQTPLELATTAALAVEHAVERGDPERGVVLARRVLGRVRGIPILLAFVAAGRLEEAEAAATAALETARSRGAALDLAVAYEARGAVRLQRGDLHGAEADATACLELLSGPGAIARGAAATVAGAGIELGRDRAGLEEIVAAARDDLDFPSAAGLLLAEAALTDDHKAAVALCLRAGELGWARDCPALNPWRSGAANALTRLGRTDEAAPLARKELAVALTPRARGVALLAAGADAVAELEEARAPVELARALLARGSKLRRAGLRSRARDDLQEAHDLASARGAVRIAEAAAAELRSSGARLRRTAARGADALPPAERRVAELAAGGLSTRDIAQSLFLSEKTVEAHLGRAYRKLGIHSRGRRAAALGDRQP